MKIATWNLNRISATAVKPAGKAISKTEILTFLNQVNADILVVTKASTVLNQGHRSPTRPTYQDLKTFYQGRCWMTAPITSHKKYRPDERHVMIYSKYKILNTFETCNQETTKCVLLNTPHGKLIVYGSVIGVLGARDVAYSNYVKAQIVDYNRFSKNADFCVIGHFALTLEGNQNYVKTGRKLLLNNFDKNNLKPLTKSLTESLEHIVVNNCFLKKLPRPQITQSSKTGFVSVSFDES